MPDYLSKELWLGLPLSSHTLPTSAIVVQLLSLANQIGTVLPWIALCFLTVEGEVVFLALFFFVRRYLLRFFIHLSIVVPVWGEVFINGSLCIELISVICLATVLVSFLFIIWQFMCYMYAVTSVFLPVTSLSLFWWGPLFLKRALHMIYLPSLISAPSWACMKGVFLDQELLSSGCTTG